MLSVRESSFYDKLVNYCLMRVVLFLPVLIRPGMNKVHNKKCVSNCMLSDYILHVYLIFKKILLRVVKIYTFDIINSYSSPLEYVLDACIALTK